MTDAPKDPRVAEDVEAMPAWRSELEALRPILLRAGLDEDFKWRKPCYTHDGSNVVIFQPFKDLCALLFFKGALLEDPDGALKEQGENTRSALRLEFRSVADVTAPKSTSAALAQADDAPIPEAPTTQLAAAPVLREAWPRLTPGRRRGWLLHFKAAKQSK